MTKTWKKVVSTLKHLVFNHEMGSLLKFSRSKTRKFEKKATNARAPQHSWPHHSFTVSKLRQKALRSSDNEMEGHMKVS